MRVSLLMSTRKLLLIWSVVDVVLKLIACLGVMCIPIDKLISYSIFLAVISISIRILYWLYCKKHFEETRGSVRLTGAYSRRC